MNTMKQRKLKYLGDIMRNDERYGLLQLIMRGKVFGKHGLGSRQNSWLKS